MGNLTIGILGGMGPRATVYFEQRLLDAFNGPDQALPGLVVVNDGSIPDRTTFLCDSSDDPVGCLQQAAEKLLSLAPDIVCMPCNTAHAPSILGRLLAAVPLPIVDMPATAIAEAQACGAKQVTVLGTVGTKISRVYGLRSQGISVCYPPMDQQAVINYLIADTKANGFANSNRDSLARIINLQRTGTVILACTELSMLNRDIDSTCTIIDALDALVRRCVELAAQKHDITKQKELVE